MRSQRVPLCLVSSERNAVHGREPQRAAARSTRSGDHQGTRFKSALLSQTEALTKHPPYYWFATALLLLYAGLTQGIHSRAAKNQPPN